MLLFAYLKFIVLYIVRVSVKYPIFVKIFKVFAKGISDSSF